jgi:hypothetical protein
MTPRRPEGDPQAGPEEPSPAMLRNMAKAKERRLRKPNKEQRRQLTNVLILLKYSEALQVEWDPEVMKEGTWEVNEERYTALHKKVVQSLCAKLKISKSMYSLGFVRASPSSAFRVELSFKDLIALGQRAGWIEVK